MILLEAAALAAFLALSAYFALVEAAVTALSAVRMKKLAFIDPVLLPHFQEWLEKPHRLLTVLMIGNNLVNVAFSSLAALAAIPLHRVFPSVVVHWTVWLLVTAVLLVGGDIVPKIVGRTYRERVAVWALPLMTRATRTLSFLWRPLDWALSRWAPSLHRAPVNPLQVVSLEELQQAAAESSAAGHLSRESGEMFHRALALTQKTVGDIARPAGNLDRLPLEVLDRPGGGERFLDLLVETGRTRVPVTRGDRPVGYVNVFDVLREGDAESGVGLDGLIRPLRWVSPATRVVDLLEEFRRSGDPFALVGTPAGEERGFLTLEDLLEQIVGDILDEYDRERTDGPA